MKIYSLKVITIILGLSSLTACKPQKKSPDSAKQALEKIQKKHQALSRIEAQLNEKYQTAAYSFEVNPVIQGGLDGNRETSLEDLKKAYHSVAVKGVKTSAAAYAVEKEVFNLFLKEKLEPPQIRFKLHSDPQDRLWGGSENIDQVRKQIQNHHK